jgi:hypothetical protein
MEQPQNNHQSLHAVMLFSPKDETITFLDHNLSWEEARQQVDHLRRQRMPAFLTTQHRRHPAVDVDWCPSCNGSGDPLVFRRVRRSSIRRVCGPKDSDTPSG